MRINNGALRGTMVDLNIITRRGISTTLLILLFTGSSQAAIFRCVDANGMNTFSDKPCSPILPTPSDEVVAAGSHRADNAPAPSSAVERAREAKAFQILQSLPLASASASDALHAQSLVDLVAPDLVKQLDAANPAWTPQHPRWHAVLEFVESDLRKNAQPALRDLTAQTGQATSREYAAHATDADMDALIKYLNSQEGSRYVAFQSELRSISAQALESLMAQEPISAAEPSDTLLRHRKQLLSLALDLRIAVDGGRRALDPSGPYSPAVMESTARREGNALDTLYNEFEAYIPGFVAFSQSITAKRFFEASEPALRTSVALSSTAAGDFAEKEFTDYNPRWRAYYGPPVRASGRITTVVRVGSVGVVSTRQVIYDGRPGGAEAAAITCEQRENANYARTHRAPDAQALKAIQNTCRREQNLPPL
jgi:hypothetical protein